MQTSKKNLQLPLNKFVANRSSTRQRPPVDAPSLSHRVNNRRKEMESQGEIQDLVSDIWYLVWIPAFAGMTVFDGFPPGLAMTTIEFVGRPSSVVCLLSILPSDRLTVLPSHESRATHASRFTRYASRVLVRYNEVLRHGELRAQQQRLFADLVDNQIVVDVLNHSIY